MHHKLIPFDGDADMETNPYITVTGSVAKFDSESRSFTMTPTQYVVLTHSTSPFPIHADFADCTSKKRWGTEGPRIAVGSSITLGGSLQRIVREHNIDKPLQFAQVEVANIAYLGSTRGNVSMSQIRTFAYSQQNSESIIIMIHLLPQLEDGSSKTRKRWNWDDLQKPSQEKSLPSQSSSQSLPKTKRKRHDNESEEDVEEHMKQEKPVDDIYQEDSK